MSGYYSQPRRASRRHNLANLARPHASSTAPYPPCLPLPQPKLTGTEWGAGQEEEETTPEEEAINLPAMVSLEQSTMVASSSSMQGYKHQRAGASTHSLHLHPNLASSSQSLHSQQPHYPAQPAGATDRDEEPRHQLFPQPTQGERGRRGRHASGGSKNNSSPVPPARRDDKKKNKEALMSVGEQRAFLQEMLVRLRKFMKSGDEELVLEPMNRAQRYQTHLATHQLGLRGTSHGKEPNRYTVVRHVKGGGLRLDSDTRQLPFLQRAQQDFTHRIELTGPQEEAINSMVNAHPIDSAELDEHVRAEGIATTETGAATGTKPRRVKKRRDNEPSYWAYAGGQQRPAVPPPPMMSPAMERFRCQLPTYDYREEILETIWNHSVTIITGGTGCGKSTQVPQFLLEQATELRRPIRICCTQPRRLPALAVAKRVAAERGERIGSTVGYHIRLEQKTSPETLLTYCTSGVLLRRLSFDPLASDVSVIILDEVHEREQCTDYLLILLREAVRQRSDLRLVLMSATMEGQLELFKRYFGQRHTGFVDIPSRLHHVEKFPLEEVLAMLPKLPHQWGFGGNGYGNRHYGSRFPVVDRFSPTRHAVNSPPSPTATPVDEEEPFGNIGFVMKCPPNTPSSTFNNGGFGNTGFGGQGASTDFSQLHDGVAETKQRVDKLLPERPPYFTLSMGSTVKRLRGKLNCAALAEFYKNDSEDYVDQQLLVEVIRYLLDSPIEGAILVFLPGFDEIMKAKDKLLNDPLPADADHPRPFRKPKVYMLHSQMRTYDQQRVFDPLSAEQSNYERKVILSTNIAEASLTIDDVVFVVDCGKSKELSYDHETRVNHLRAGWVAKSNAEQRAGRAGRCRDGFCFQLFSRHDYEVMLSNQIPEMRRAAIHDICLNAKMFAPRDLSAKDFLSRAPDPPEPASVTASLLFLEQLGALYHPPRFCHYHHNRGGGGGDGGGPDDQEPEITELGRLIAHLPLEPQSARLLLFGLVLRCFDPVITLVAALSYQDRTFVLPMADAEEKISAQRSRESFAMLDYSDHLTLIRAYNAYASVLERGSPRQVEEFCRERYLNPMVMNMISGIRRQLTWELKRLHLLPSDYSENTTYSNRRYVSSSHTALNAYSESWPMVQCAIVAGCYPGIGFVTARKWRKIHPNVDGGATAGLHPSSVLKRQVGMHAGPGKPDPQIDILAYHELSRLDEGLMLKTITAVTPLAVALFAGPIRMPRELMNNFELAEEDLNAADLARAAAIAAASSDHRFPRPRTPSITPNFDEDGEEDWEMEGEQDGQEAVEMKQNAAFGRCLAEENQRYLQQPRDKPQQRQFIYPEQLELDQMVELEPWLAFRGRYPHLRALLRLRFKLMNHFIHRLHNARRKATSNNMVATTPAGRVSKEEEENSKDAEEEEREELRLLECLNSVLVTEHVRQDFAPCTEWGHGFGESYQRSQQQPPPPPPPPAHMAVRPIRGGGGGPHPIAFGGAPVPQVKVVMRGGEVGRGEHQHQRRRQFFQPLPTQPPPWFPSPQEASGRPATNNSWRKGDDQGAGSRTWYPSTTTSWRR